MTLIYVQSNQLKLHPQNIRRFYPQADVEEMAASLLATGQSHPSGNLQALLIIPDGDEPDRYLVVDGNMRLAAARHLGDACPPLKCEVISAGQADQLLIMLSTSAFHYPKDPISQGLHYRRLQEQEGLTADKIAELTGVKPHKIYQCMLLLELDDPIQYLIAAGELSQDIRVCRALKKVPNPALRVKLAQRFAKRGTSIKQIQRSCAHAAEMDHRVNGAPAPVPPAGTQPAKPVLSFPALDDQTGVTWQRLDDIAGKTLCDDCKLDCLGKACYTCPGPYEFIQHLLEMSETRLKKAA